MLMNLTLVAQLKILPKSLQTHKNTVSPSVISQHVTTGQGYLCRYFSAADISRGAGAGRQAGSYTIPESTKKMPQSCSPACSASPHSYSNHLMQVCKQTALSPESYTEYRFIKAPCTTQEDIVLSWTVQLYSCVSRCIKNCLLPTLHAFLKPMQSTPLDAKLRCMQEAMQIDGKVTELCTVTLCLKLSPASNCLHIILTRCKPPCL